MRPFVFWVGLALAGISLVFATTGLLQLFEGATVSIIAMTVTFEAAKVACVVAIVGMALPKGLRRSLMGVIAVLTLISTLGVIGHLSAAYEVGRMEPRAMRVYADLVQQSIDRVTSEKLFLDEQLRSIPTDHSSNKLRFHQAIAPRITHLDSHLEVLTDSLAKLNISEQHSSIGNLSYTAALVGVDEERFGAWLVLLLAIILDPIALLLITTGHARKEPTGTNRPALQLSRPLEDFAARLRRNNKAASA